MIYPELCGWTQCNPKGSLNVEQGSRKVRVRTGMRERESNPSYSKAMVLKHLSVKTHSIATGVTGHHLQKWGIQIDRLLPQKEGKRKNKPTLFL